MKHLPQHHDCASTVADDILDVTASTEALGKTAGKDLNMDKTTYPKLMGQCVSACLLAVLY